MRPRLPRTILAAALLAAAPVSQQVSAQVTVNPGALELLPAPKPQTPPRPPARPPARPATRPAAPNTTPTATTPTTTTPTATATPPTPAALIGPPAPPPKPPVLPTVPPAIAALPPPVPVPPPRPQPAPVIAVAPDAPGTASPVPGGLRITFGPDRQDLNPITEAALRSFAKTLHADPATTVNIYAYAQGVAEDPSTPRRLALARALTARGVLINEGIASTRIYPRALGPTGGDTDKDRVDVVTGAPGPPAGQAVAPTVSPASATAPPAK